MTLPPTIGVVLGGGLSRRMGGGDKGQTRIGSATMIERVIGRLRPQCAAVVLNSNGAPAPVIDIQVVADSMPDRPGPLAGILAGLDWTAANAPDVAWVVSAPHDSPFLPRDLVARLHQARNASDATLARARSADRNHPVAALWPVALRDDLRRAMTTENMRRVSEWAARYPLATAEWPAEPFDPFFNINTPEDLAEAEHLAARFPEA